MTLTSVSKLKAEGFPETLISEVLHSRANSNYEIGFKNSAANGKWHIWRDRFVKEVANRCGK